MRLKISEKKVWSRVGDDLFFGSPRTIKELKPGIYSPYWTDSMGYGLKSVPSTGERIITLKSKEYEIVLKDIQKFWRSKKQYDENNILYRRGILMHGPPGCGKSFLIKRLAQEIINEHNGIVLLAEDPTNLKNAIQLIRTIQPDIPILVIYEDFDTMIKEYGSSLYLQLMDGFISTGNIVNIVTTNHAESLEERIVNRPGRFDIRVHIGLPDLVNRKIYFKEIGMKDKLKVKEVNDWANKTDGFTFAHMNELYTSVSIMGYGLEDSIERLEDMHKDIQSEKLTKKTRVGFSSSGRH